MLLYIIEGDMFKKYKSLLPGGFHRCGNPGCRIWIGSNKFYCNACFKNFWATDEKSGFYDLEYEKGDGNLKIYEGE